MEAPTPKKSTTSSSSCAIASLPNPALMEILCRMSIKTLTISKSVCKSWLNLIKDPKFCQLYQRISPTEVCFQPFDESKYNNLELHLGNFDSPNVPYQFEIPKFTVSPQNVPYYNAVKGRFIFANSCNGLLCYYGDDPDYRFAMVWNPCTSEFITFPPSHCRGYGLGFSRKENKFKLLRLIGARSCYDNDVADICTIEKSCSWKRVGPCSSHAWARDSCTRVHEYLSKASDLHSVFLQGTLHWVGLDKSRIAIHTFDFEDDHFGTLALPPGFNGDKVGVLGGCREDRLGVFGDCLCVADYKNGWMAIWVMMEYGVQGSWMKLFRFGSALDKRVECHYCLPVIYMDNGEILMTFTCACLSSVSVYNPDLESRRVVGSGPISLRVMDYRPSLVRLKDSMLGYRVHVKPKGDALKQVEAMKESLRQHGSKQRHIKDGELRDVRVGEDREGCVRATRIAGQSKVLIRDVKGKDRATLSNEQDELPQGVTLVEANKSGQALMLEKEKLKHRDKELEQRDKELEHRGKELELKNKILEQRDKLLNILQELDNTDQSQMTTDEKAHHLSKIKRYENLVARTFDQ